ncbi:FAD-binding protein [uncultured Slackia sp.]|uniref:FAD-dependent oxidoreductase n=1 Tax=uncultured Slackia sp. TaxID=665903 RepID=UPI0025CCC7C6|nr:FAD-binding protein [uncultured Slackia sp.]
MSKSIHTEGITRRNFLTGAAVAGAGATLMGLVGCSSGGGETSKETSGEDAKAPESVEVATDAKPWEVAPEPIPDSEIDETVDCDIVIVGAGIAGLPASMLAAEQGANVHIVEKAGTYGTARLCTSGFNAKLQAENGIHYDRKEFISEAWKITNGVQGRMSSYGKWFDNSGPYVDWLQEIFQSQGYDLVAQQVNGFKVTNDGIGQQGYESFWTAFASMIYFVDKDGKTLDSGVNPDWTGIMAKYAEDHGATFHYNSPAVQLVRDENGEGRVTSVICETEDGSYVKYNASKGILLTTGDFASNKEMMGYYNRSLLKASTAIAEVKNTGDGHKMGLWVGADIDDFACGDCFPFVGVTLDNKRPQSDQTKSYAAVASLPVLMVDCTGRRIAAENLPFQGFSIPKITSTPDGAAFSVWDSAWESKFPSDYPKGDYLSTNTAAQVEIDIEAGTIHKADTLEELAEIAGFDKDIFVANVERYNELCEKGEDLDFYKSPLWMTTIDTPPYYVSKHIVSVTSTRGGLKINDQMQVLDKKGLAIPGLYAAGNTAGSFYGNVYPPNIMGTGIGHGQCFGWLAIKDMLGMEVL